MPRALNVSLSEKVFGGEENPLSRSFRRKSGKRTNVGPLRGRGGN